MALNVWQHTLYARCTLVSIDIYCLGLIKTVPGVGKIMLWKVIMSTCTDTYVPALILL